MSAATIGARLREERERLGLSQSAFGALAGVAKGTVINWEKGHSGCNTAVLEIWQGAGADISYIVTGRHAEHVDDLGAIFEVSDAIRSMLSVVPTSIRVRLLKDIIRSVESEA